MIKGEEDKQFCKQCGRGPMKRHQYIFDFYNSVQCSERCKIRYEQIRAQQYDDYVDPLRRYRGGGKHD